MGSTNDYNELFTSSSLFIYSNILPYKSTLLHKCVSTCTLVTSLPLVNDIKINQIFLTHYKSNFVVLFASTMKRTNYLFIISLNLVYEYKYITNTIRNKKEEIPIIKSNELTITVTPIEEKVYSPIIYDINILNRIGKVEINNKKKMINNKRIREEENIKGKSIDEIYNYFKSMKKK